jgi:hypothetical protein
MVKRDLTILQRPSLGATVALSWLQLQNLGSEPVTMLPMTAGSILDHCHKALLLVCLAAMVFCWTQAVRSHHPLLVRMGVTAASNATASIIGRAGTPVASLWDASAHVLVAGRVHAEQTAHDRVEPVLPIAAVIAARSGGFFPLRDCADEPALPWNSRDAVGAYLAALIPHVDPRYIAQRFDLRCGQINRGKAPASAP